MASLNIAKFVREVRQEAARVTWPTRRETSVTAFMVIALVAVAATFFLVVDMLAGSTIHWILGIGG